MGIILRSVIAPVAGAIAAGATRGGTPSGRLTSLPGSDGPIACAQRRSRCKPGRAAGIVGAVPGARARRLRHG